MEETSEELPNFSIGIDFLGPDPTSTKNKAEKNFQVARFANLNLNLNKNVAFFDQPIGMFVTFLCVMRILRSIAIKKASSRRSLMSLCYKRICSCF